MSGGHLRVGLIVKVELPGAMELARRIMGLFPRDDIILERRIARRLGARAGTVGELRSADAIITIGGDGTVLFAHSLAPNVPFLGINLGERGFLAEVSPRQACRAVRMLKSGKLEVGKRERISGTAGGKRIPEALNDVAVVSADPGKTITLRAEVDRTLAFEVKGDGVLLSTPTGSTAYAHAAGGPIMDPRVEAFLLVPICPSAPRISPFVVPISGAISIALKNHGRKAAVLVDGRRICYLHASEEVRLRRSDSPALFFRWSEFYQKVREKLH
ncbi:MAG: NAD(+)/NADH kinase [Candidatus Hadarchaeales archaeon]